MSSLHGTPVCFAPPSLVVQGEPLFAGGGLLHSRAWFRVPGYESCEQGPSPQGPQLPLTSKISMQKQL